jgi:Coenzyme PQQ synthesis protein D (PqqD)
VSAYARSPDVHTVELDGEAVLLDEAAGRLHRLNEAGTTVWLALDGASDAHALAGLLASDRAHLAEARAAVEALLAHLAEEGLVV